MPGYRQPSSYGRRPVGLDVRAGLRRLVAAGNLRRPGDCRERRRGGGVDGAGGGHRRLADGASAALEPEVLTFVGVQVLLPQARGRGVGGLLVDGLAVVAADDGVAG